MSRGNPASRGECRGPAAPRRFGDDADAALAEGAGEGSAVHADSVRDVGVADAVGAAEEQARFPAKITDFPLHGRSLFPVSANPLAKAHTPLDAACVGRLQDGKDGLVPSRTAAQSTGPGIVSNEGGRGSQYICVLGVDRMDGSREPEALEIPDDDGTRSAFGGCPDDGNGMWEKREARASTESVSLMTSSFKIHNMKIKSVIRS